MSFKEYMAEVRSIWLPLGWVDIVRRKMLASTQEQRPFSEWAIDVQSKNTLLRGTASHLADVNVLYHLEARMNTELAADYDAENIVEEDLRKWIEKVRILDENRVRYLVRQKEAIEAALRAECARSNADKKANTNFRSNGKGGNTQSKDTSNSTSKSTAFTRLPPLTENERQLLRENDGHTSSNCQKGFPDGASYKTLTASTIVAKKTKKSKDVVVAVDVEEDSDTVTVVIPSAVLGDGTDSGEDSDW
ncbi:hypothetical protein F4604DRAFT_1778348 [Suillus subluteus]|nr:hypothetical protein F4604DRAFT_1778348 [Suillus subluteus]